MARFRYALDWISAVLMWIALAAGTLMMLHVSVDVAARSFFRAPLYGTTEIVAAYYMIAIAFLPWAWITKRDQHIAADVFTDLMPPKLRRAVFALALVLTIVFVTLFTYQTLLAAIKQTRGNESWLAGIYYLAVWPSRWLLPLAGVLMLLQLIVRLASTLTEPLPEERPAE